MVYSFDDEIKEETFLAYTHTLTHTYVHKHTDVCLIDFLLSFNYELTRGGSHLKQTVILASHAGQSGTSADEKVEVEEEDDDRSEARARERQT